MKKYKVSFTRKFQKDYKKLPKEIQNKIDQQIRKLTGGDFFYPSLRAKKMEGEENIWETSITMNYRMIFCLEENVMIFLKVGIHDIL
jgi:addiction module RelE/StbE family toxin